MVELKPRISKKSNRNRKLYEKGWHYEQIAKKIIYQKLFDAGLKAFIVKAPYSYPFDLITFIPANGVYFWEIRFTTKNSVYVPKRKILKTKAKIKGYNGFVFKYFVLAFFSGKHDYKIFEIDLTKKAQDYIFKK